MAQTRSTGARRAKKLDSGAKANVAQRTAAEMTAAEPKPPRRRISRRKAVEHDVRSYFDPLDRRYSRAMAEHWSADGVADIVPLSVLRGPTEIVGLFSDVFAALPDLETTVTRVVAGEHEAAVEVADGKNASVTAYYDGMSFARQIGLMSTQGSAPERAMQGALNPANKLRRAVAARTSGR